MKKSTLAILQGLKSVGINFIVSFPCVLLEEVIRAIDSERTFKHVRVTREEEGVGISAGAYLGGKKPAILMQNSGLGNSINAFASLINFYRIPLLLLISHRGVLGEEVAAQIPMGLATPKLLQVLGIPFFEPFSAEEISKTIKKAQAVAESNQKPFAILLTKPVLAK
ncbi:MAG: sulfopyruvate decarboxylase subunit alpha [Euryarchaeota archaeon]|nr:sulfopyruvate decarboxylase subunit alpha [Euryarchaeota archaeon]